MPSVVHGDSHVSDRIVSSTVFIAVGDSQVDTEPYHSHHSEAAVVPECCIALSGYTAAVIRLDHVEDHTDDNVLNANQ